MSLDDSYLIKQYHKLGRKKFLEWLNAAIEYNLKHKKPVSIRVFILRDRVSAGAEL